ncbi:hypothetical protein CTheo_8194 [Ceratobasidium theobromae]|uniref:Effector protein n=1 Tax=Ceratobasidium theobromae TaxID=1582974 RepID=A0A5N5Q9C1_9AGAM|nr:hypothetical protein CTheo_8194 [Ceratobasidium theobromae]
MRAFVFLSILPLALFTALPTAFAAPNPDLDSELDARAVLSLPSNHDVYHSSTNGQPASSKNANITPAKTTVERLGDVALVGGTAAKEVVVAQRITTVFATLRARFAAAPMAGVATVKTQFL